MKHFRKLLTTTLASVMLLSSLPLNVGVTNLVKPITACAAEIETGVSGVPINIASGVTLYMELNDTCKRATVVGSKIKKANTVVTIPLYIQHDGKEYMVNNFGRLSFGGQTNLKKLIVDNGVVKEIGSGAFMGCSNLEEVKISYNDWLMNIKDSAFKGCTSLKDIEFASESQSIGAHAFWDCTKITSIDIPHAASIGEAAFYNCTDAREVTIACPCLRSIPSFCFYNCSSLTDLNNNCPYLYRIEPQAFAHCTNLTTASFQTVQTVETSAFWGCSNLKTVDMPALDYVSSHAFFLCPNLTTFIGGNLKRYAIGDYGIGWYYDGVYVQKNADICLYGPANGSLQKYAEKNGFKFSAL